MDKNASMSDSNNDANWTMEKFLEINAKIFGLDSQSVANGDDAFNLSICSEDPQAAANQNDKQRKDDLKEQKKQEKFKKFILGNDKNV